MLEFPNAMEDLKELDPILYKWCIANGYEARYTSHGSFVYGDFGNGFREELPFQFFRAVSYAIMEGRGPSPNDIEDEEDEES